MKSLHDHLTEYIAARRALGTQLQESAKTLSQFVDFLARRKAGFITIQLALEWSQQSQGVQRATWARKLSMVRQFARWMSVIDPRHQVPPRRLLDVRHRRGKPHIYSDEEIARLMAEASGLKSSKGMKALTLENLIGLLAATGLRPGEASALEIGDVDLDAGVLVIRESKFGKSRHVPIHKSTIAALEQYAQHRDHIFPNPCSSFFFVSDRGAALDLGVVRKWFCKISCDCDLRKRSEGNRCGRGPRLQDLRHHSERRIIPSGV
jgi:integrase